MRFGFAKGWKDPLFLGIVAVLLAASGWLYRGGTGPESNAQSARSGSVFVAGSRFPAVTAYDQMGARREVLPRGQAALVIFRADCTCDDIAVRQWVAAAARAGEQPIIVVATSPHKLARFRRESNFAGRILATTAVEMRRLKLSEEYLPLAVRVSAVGIVRSS